MMRKNLWKSDVEETWNAVASYYDTLNALVNRYYDAVLSPGSVDDLQSFKLLLDHCFCKLQNRMGSKELSRLVSYQKAVENGFKGGLVEWFDQEVTGVELVNTETLGDGYEMGEVPSQHVLMRRSDSKKKIMTLFRELMLAMDLLGSFQKERKLNPPGKIFDKELRKGEDDYE
ncbi:MAG: hypothetical protein ABIJ21_06330 [Nanoarchaeota archaeon]